jgi:predicted amidohydrolase
MMVRVSVPAVLLVLAAVLDSVAADATLFAFSSVGPEASINATLPLYARDMQEADAAGASWLLFPEFSLFAPQTRQQTFLECASAPAVLATLGAMLARSRTLHFALVNLCVVEEDSNGTLLFNANFILSAATGDVAAVYRKVSREEKE